MQLPDRFVLDEDLTPQLVEGSVLEDVAEHGEFDGLSDPPPPCRGIGEIVGPFAATVVQ